MRDRIAHHPYIFPLKTQKPSFWLGLFTAILDQSLIRWLSHAEQTFADPTVIPLADVSLMLSGHCRFGGKGSHIL